MKIKFKLAPNLRLHNYVQDILLSHQNAFPYGTHTYSTGTQRDELNWAVFVSYISFFFVLCTFVLYSKDTMAWKWKAQLTLQDQLNNLLSWDNLLVHFQGKFILLSWCKMKLQITESTKKRAENKPKSILEKPNLNLKEFPKIKLQSK